MTIKVPREIIDKAKDVAMWMKINDIKSLYGLCHTSMIEEGIGHLQRCIQNYDFLEPEDSKDWGPPK